MLLSASPALAKPTIGPVTPSNAAAGQPVTLSATISSAAPIESCNLYVDLADVGAMNVHTGSANKEFTFPFGGSRLAFVFCRDVNGGINSGPNTAIWVSGPTEQQAPLQTGSQQPPQQQPQQTQENPSDEIPAGTLIKLICGAGADVNDPCRAVYYVDDEGYRHPFPNARVFATWYANFDSVVEVDLETMSSFQLGGNVRYRPGSRMVKFTTDNRVFAVSRFGELRWVPTEEIAIALYGSDWNMKIDDIPDTFFTDYIFGPDIASATDYSIQSEMDAVTRIDDNRS